MTPFSTHQSELAIAVATAESRCSDAWGADWRDAAPNVLRHANALERMTLQDHRVAVAGDLADALDRIEPELGTRFMRALYPEVLIEAVPL